MATIHFSGIVDCQHEDYTINGQSVVDALFSQGWPMGQVLAVHHNGELVAEGPLGLSTDGKVAVVDIGEFDLFGLLEDEDTLVADLTISDEHEPEGCG